MELVTDPELLNQLRSDFQSQGAQRPLSQQQPQEENDGSILGTSLEGIKSQLTNLSVQEFIDDPEYGEYAKFQMQKQRRRHQEERAKLGTIGGFASDLGVAAPAIAAFASTPITGVAGLGVGAGLSGMQAGADILGTQLEETGTVDRTSAALGGVATGVTDLGLSLLGGKAARELGGRLVAKPGMTGISGGINRMAPAVAPVAADVTIGDAGSAAASQVYHNLATGKPWHENTGYAALVGGVAGGAIRGTTHSVSKALEIPLNKGGEAAAARAGSFASKVNTPQTQDFLQGYVDKQNAATGIRDELYQKTETDPDFGEKLAAYNNLSNDAAADRAAMDFIEMIPNLHINAAGLDVTSGARNVGSDIFGLDPKTMADARAVSESTDTTMFRGVESEANLGLSPEAHKYQIEKTYREALKKGNVNHSENMAYLNEEIFKLEQAGNNPIRLQELETIRGLLSKLHTQSRRADSEPMVKELSNQIRALSLKAGGVLDNMKSFSGKKGEFDGYGDYLLERMVWDSATKMHPNFKNAISDPFKKSQSKGSADSLADLGINLATFGTRPVIKGGANLYRRFKAKSSLNQTQEMARNIQRPKTRGNEELAQGDLEGATRSAVDDLQSKGLLPEDTPPTPPDSPTPPPTRTISDEPSEAAQRVREDLIRQERGEGTVENLSTTQEPVEAPVSPSESVPAQTKVDAKAPTKPTEKSPEAVVEEPVVEAPKPEAKAKPAPKLSRAQKKKLQKEAYEAKKAQEESEKKAANARKPAAEPKRFEEDVEKGQQVVEEPAPIAEPDAPQSEVDSSIDAGKDAQVSAKKVQAKLRPGPKKKEVVEEPAPAPEPTPEKPKVDAKTVAEPLKKLADETYNIGRRQKDPEGFQEHLKAKKELQVFNDLIEGNAKYTKDEMAGFIHDAGGISKFLADAKAAGKTPQQYLTRRIQDQEALAKNEAARKVAEVKELLKQQRKTEETTAESDATATREKEKRDREKAESEKARADRKEFDGWVEAKGIHPEDAAVVFDFLDAGNSISNARVMANRLMSARNKGDNQSLITARKEAAEAKRDAAKEKLNRERQDAQDDAERKKLADAQKAFDNEMEAMGYHEADLAQVYSHLNKGGDFSSGRKMAQRLNKERKNRMEQDIKDREKDLEKNQKALEEQGKASRVLEYLKELDALDIPGVKEAVRKVFRHNQGTVAPAKIQGLLNKIDDLLDKEAKRYEDALRRLSAKDPRAVEAEAAGKVVAASKNKLRTTREELDAARAQAEANVKSSGEELRALQKEFDEQFKETQIKNEKAEKVVAQKEELARDLEEWGVPEGDIANIVARTFLKRELLPLTPKEMRAAILRAADAANKARETRITGRQKEIAKVVEGSDPQTLIAMSREVTTESNLTKGDSGSNEDFVAMAAVLRKAMEEQGLTREADRLRIMGDAIREGLANKAKYPDNPELWVSAEPFRQISELFGNQQSNYQGNLGTAIKLMVVGKKGDVGDFGTLSEARMKKEQQAMDAKNQGALATGGLTDVVMKTAPSAPKEPVKPPVKPETTTKPVTEETPPKKAMGTKALLAEAKEKQKAIIEEKKAPEQSTEDFVFKKTPSGTLTTKGDGYSGSISKRELDEGEKPSRNRENYIWELEVKDKNGDLVSLSERNTYPLARTIKEAKSDMKKELEEFRSEQELKQKEGNGTSEGAMSEVVPTTTSVPTKIPTLTKNKETGEWIGNQDGFEVRAYKEDPDEPEYNWEYVIRDSEGNELDVNSGTAENLKEVKEYLQDALDQYHINQK